jgi:4-methyl-5(b-hydroxyethyl)-thiazole monophosphate biosynthesis
MAMAAASASAMARRAASWPRLLLLSRAFAAAAAEPTRVLVPVADGTEPVEAAATADVLNRAGARVTVATADPAGDDRGLLVEAAFGVKLVADGRVADLEGEAFDLIALPGGMPGSANLRDCKVLEKMVKKQAEQGGLYAAICATPAVTLAHWGLLKGLKVATWIIIQSGSIHCCGGGFVGNMYHVERQI